MPGTLTPAQMFDHELNPVKGWPSPYAVDKSKQVADGETGIVPGRVVHLDNATQKFKMGCPASATVAAMPIFAFQGQNDFDVNGDVGNIITGTLTGLVGIGAYELETTEYAGTGFTSNVPLAVENTPGADLGKVKASTLNAAATVVIVGVVSDAGPIVNDFKKNVVRFWPCYLPVR